MKTVLNKNWLAFIARFFLFSFIWWIFSEGAIASWLLGVPAVLLAVTVSLLCIPPVSVVWYEVVRFVPFFLFHSLISAADVAWRALHPGMLIAPDLIDYPLRISPGLPQIFMANTVSLLPGTLSVELDQCVLRVHVLDKQKNYMTEIESVEQRVARLFAVPLNDGEKDKRHENI